MKPGLIKGNNIYIYMYIYIYYIPVCTAQGGGGSFKDRKPIGKIRCCQSWMASKSTDGSKSGWRQRNVVVVVVLIVIAMQL